MIEIKEDVSMSGISTFSFGGSNHYDGTAPEKYKKCHKCNRPVFTHYSFIIDKLREAGILPNNYKLICCYCYKQRPLRCRSCGDRIGGMALDGYCYKCGNAKCWEI